MQGIFMWKNFIKNYLTQKFTYATMDNALLLCGGFVMPLNTFTNNICCSKYYMQGVNVQWSNTDYVL